MNKLDKNSPLRKQVIDAYCEIRTYNHTVPDNVLDFMYNSALEKFESVSPSHSEETENTGKQYTFKQGKEGFDIIKPDGFIFCCCGHLEEDAKDMCDSLNSYSTLKADNERLEQEVLKLESENEKQLSELLKTGETLDACENVLADAQIDNEAKDKRIQEQQRLLGIAHYFIGQLNVLEFTSEQSARAKEIYSQLQSALTPPIDTKP